MGEDNKKVEPGRIEEILSYGGIFVWDASSLCAKGFKKCVQSIFPAIQKSSDSFIVPSFVKAELTLPDGAPALMVLDKKMFLEYPNVNSYSELLSSLKARNISKVNIFVNDITVKNQVIGEGKAAGVFVYFYSINEDGEIENFRSTQKAEPKQQKPEWKPQFQSSKKPGFTIKSQPERVPFAPISVDREIKAGDVVRDSKGESLKLVNQESVNNGAVTYSTDKAGIWTKIFHRNALNTYTAAKIERMLTQQMNCEGLCWPIDIVKDENGVFRGYTLKEFKGVPLHLCIFKRAGIDSYFPDWNKMDLCELAQTILRKIEFLHKRNVLFGCLNPAAIRVVGRDEVYFTDTDNYQIDGFPSMVHNISFTAPELLDKKVYLATKANENFAIAELVFMLMMPGKTPYAVGGDEAPVKLIKSMNFPYSNGKIHGDKALPGMWRFMWSHLASLKGCFFNVFQNGGKYSNPEDRRDVSYWENAIGYYMDDLKETEDKESLMIYPRTFKRGGDEVFYRCNYCGVEHPRFYFYNKYFDDFQICNSCIDKRSEVSFTCKACGKTYYYTNRTALFHKMMKMQDSDWKDQKYCRDCKRKTLPCQSCGKEVPYFYLKGGMCSDCRQEQKNLIYSQARCTDCGRTFEITVWDHEFYRSKGWSDPSRCPECRERRKNGGGTYGNGGTAKKGGLFGWLFD